MVQNHIQLKNENYKISYVVINEVWATTVQVFSLITQLGPNPSSLNHQALGRGQSGILAEDGTLYLVNQIHPFTIHFTTSSNGTASSSAQKRNSDVRKRETEEKKTAPKRNIQDFFTTSPKKVPFKCFRPWLYSLSKI